MKHKITKLKLAAEKQPLYLLCVLLLFVSCLSYFEFLNGSRFFTLIADPIDQTLPEQYNLINIIEESGFSMWSFYKGLGQQSTVGNPNWTGDLFALLPMLDGKMLIPYCYGFVAVLKIFLSGMFFYKFLEELNVAPFTRVLFSFFYAFNGHMVCRGLWFHYATEVVFAALLLWALERYCRGKKLLFPAALGLLFLSRNAAYVYIYSGLSYLYIILRHSFMYGFNLKKQIINIGKFIPWYLLGLGISAILIFPGIYYLLASPRMHDVLAIPSFTTLLNVITVVLKSFSCSIMGAVSTTGPSGVILEDPILYCGIFTMLIFTQIFRFRQTPKREKNIVYIMLGLIVIYYIFPIAKYFLNAFSATYYKTSSFWSIIFLLLSGVYVLNKIELGKEHFSRSVFLFTALLYLGILGVIYVFRHNIIQTNALVLVLVTILLLAGVCCLIKSPRRCGLLVLLISVVEVGINVNLEITDEHFLHLGKETRSDYYNEALQYTIDSLKEQDDSLYRIITATGFYNYSQRYSYMGVSNYSSISSSPVYDFFSFFDLLFSPDSPGIFPDFNERYMLNTLVGVKYYIKNSPEATIPEGFEYAFRLGNYDVYQNTQYLPLGYVYDSYISEEDLQDRSDTIKDFSVLNAVMLSEEDIAVLEENGLNIPEYDLTDILPYGDSEIPYDDYADAVSHLRKTPFTIDYFSQNHIEGNVTLKEDGVLFLSIPCEKGWHLKVNGEDTDYICGNAGFISVPLEAGTYAIELSFVTKMLIPGAVVSTISVLIWFILLFYRRKRGFSS